MSSEITTPDRALPDDRALMIEQINKGELTTTLSAETLRSVLVNLDHSLTFAAAAAQLIGTDAGPQAEGLAAHLKTMNQVGAGYLRHCVDTIRALQRAERKAAAAAKKKGA